MTFTSEKLLVVVGRAVDAIGSLVFLKMLATLASKSDVGTYLLAASFLALLLTVSFSALDQGLLRNVTEYRQQAALAECYSAMLVAYLGLALLLAGVAAGAVLAFDIGEALQGVMVPLVLWFALDALKNLNLTVASGLRSRGLIALASAADYGCRLALLWAAYSWMRVSSTVIVGLLAAASLLATSVFVWGNRNLLSRFPWSRVRTTLLASFHFAWPMMIWGLFGWLQNMSNRWLLSRYADLSVVAEYGVLVAIASFPVTAVLGLVVTYTVPILYERESAVAGSSRKVVVRVAALLSPLCAALVLVAALWHRELVILLSGPGYVENSHVLPFLMAAASASAICSVLTYAIFAQRRLSSLLIANISPGLLGLVLGYFAVSRFQFEGAILTLATTQLIAAMLFTVAFVRSGRLVTSNALKQPLL